MKHDIKLWCLAIHWDGDYAAQGDVTICTTLEACKKAFEDTLYDWKDDGRVKTKEEIEKIKVDISDAEYEVSIDERTGFPKFEYHDGDYTTAQMEIYEVDLMEENISIPIM